MRLLLVGAGGHARSIVDAVADSGYGIAAYTALSDTGWLDAQRVADDAADPADFDGFVMGMGGVDPDGLRRRLDIHGTYEARGFAPVAVVHGRAIVAPGAVIAEGASVLAGAIVNPGVVIGAGAIVNTGAIVEHDVRIGTGTHVAPGAILLGGVTVGACAMIGAGAVVLPGAEVPDGTLVRALTRFPK